jgi:hypothetical protein
VVVSGTGLEPGGGSRRFDATEEAGTHAGPEYVVHGLGRNLAELVSHGGRDFVCIRMWVSGNHIEYCNTRSRHSQPHGTKLFPGVEVCVIRSLHGLKYAAFLELVKKRNDVVVVTD